MTLTSLLGSSLWPCLVAQHYLAGLSLNEKGRSFREAEVKRETCWKRGLGEEDQDLDSEVCNKLLRAYLKIQEGSLVVLYTEDKKGAGITSKGQ